MSIIFLSLGIGFIIGYKKILSQRFVTLNGRFQTASLFLLIFFMGVSIGNDDAVFQNIASIGIKAFAFAVACIAGSVGAVYIASKIFLKSEEDAK